MSCSAPGSRTGADVPVGLFWQLLWIGHCPCSVSLCPSLPREMRFNLCTPRGAVYMGTEGVAQHCKHSLMFPLPLLSPWNQPMESRQQKGAHLSLTLHVGAHSQSVFITTCAKENMKSFSPVYSFLYEHGAIFIHGHAARFKGSVY